jgi:hypothetical protein
MTRRWLGSVLAVGRGDMRAGAAAGLALLAFLFAQPRVDLNAFQRQTVNGKQYIVVAGSGVDGAELIAYSLR